MACTLDLKLVLKHLANGTICENLCRVCLKPLNDDCENIFTKICKEDKEYCIADVLNDLCQIKVRQHTIEYLKHVIFLYFFSKTRIN